MITTVTAIADLAELVYSLRHGLAHIAASKVKHPHLFKRFRNVNTSR